MLEPREADIPILFLVLVVLPLVAYVLLGKWSEAAKKRERISLLAQLAAEEALMAEVTATPSTVLLVSASKNEIHICARCSSPATTRCSRCKSVRYCSGKCQIIHWRQVHKQECQQLETTSSCSSPKDTTIGDFITESISTNDSLNPICHVYNNKQVMLENIPTDNANHPSIRMIATAASHNSIVDTYHESIRQRKSTDKRISQKSYRERRQGAADSSEETSGSEPTNLTSSGISNVYINAHDTANGLHETLKYKRQHGTHLESRSKNESSSSLHTGKNCTTAYGMGSDFSLSGVHDQNTSNGERIEQKCSHEMEVMQGSLKDKSVLHSMGSKNSKSSKSTVEAFEEQLYSEIGGRGQVVDDSRVNRLRGDIPASERNGITNIGIMKMMGLRKSTKLARQTELSGIGMKATMLFPYEEFVKIFNCEDTNLSPRGLVNCGNSCYANAVLQCLTFTKPLIIFLLRRSHSRACHKKDWCLMCELEQHVILLRDSWGTLSPSRILLHMRNTNCQIGDGSQEDAHEFLRLLVASMQSICLEALGGENKVDHRLQETTFIQHTFGGRLRSKVKCLKCYHESERYENIMDLTLEIFGWVESLEDALTQFTTPEELDGENMYRCGRCATYVRARKQLSIHEAPNILTIVLKRFQEGKYGKINKCITFPELLDMIPFMTGMGDIPPLYMLYAVVVHLDTLNASFSGHYVAYVKDLQGSWFRIDDTEVYSVPMSRVMSEGAYMLFYIRSCPRPQNAFHENAFPPRVPVSARDHTSRTQKASRQAQSRSSSHFVGADPSLNQLGSRTGVNSHANEILRTANRNITPMVEFSDATSSDWSLFTSSDEASFTTESTRDSFSTVDYNDATNGDTFLPIFNNLHAAESSSGNPICRRKFSSSRPQTRFISEERGYVLDSYLSTQLPHRPWKGENSKQVSKFSTKCSTDSHCTMPVKYDGSTSNFGLDRTSSCNL